MFKIIIKNVFFVLYFLTVLVSQLSLYCLSVTTLLHWDYTHSFKETQVQVCDYVWRKQKRGKIKED